MNRQRVTIYASALLLLLAASPYVSGQSRLFEGRPVFSEGSDLGYYLWKDGDEWHVRWTTRGQMRRFTGFVEATGGKLKSLKRIDVEKERQVIYPGRAPNVWVGSRGRVHTSGGRRPVTIEREQDKIDKEGDSRIVFSARTNNDIDGFDFKLDKGVAALRFVLEIEGKSFPRLVEIGSTNAKAPKLPLEITVP
jgi:hypothetical protein